MLHPRISTNKLKSILLPFSKFVPFKIKKYIPRSFNKLDIKKLSLVRLVYVL